MPTGRERQPGRAPPEARIIASCCAVLIPISRIQAVNWPHDIERRVALFVGANPSDLERTNNRTCNGQLLGSAFHHQKWHCCGRSLHSKNQASLGCDAVLASFGMVSAFHASS